MTMTARTDWRVFLLVLVLLCVFLLFMLDFGQSHGVKKSHFVLVVNQTTTQSIEASRVCQTANFVVQDTSVNFAQALRLLWICSPTVSSTPTPSPHTIEPTRLAVLQAGLLSSWFQDDTIKYVVKPMVARGWQVDVFIKLQNDTSPGLRYSSSIHREPLNTNMTAEEIRTRFSQNVSRVGGNVRHFEIIDGVEDIGIASSPSVWTKMRHKIAIAAKADRKIAILRQFWSAWELWEKAVIQEHTTGQLYTWVLRLREDAGWLLRPPFELATPGISYFRVLNGVGGTADKAFLLPARHATPFLHHMAFAFLTANEGDQIANPEHLVDIALKRFNIPHKSQRGKLKRNRKGWVEFGLCVADLVNHAIEGKCYQKDYVGADYTWPKRSFQDGSNFIYPICRSY